MAKCYWTKPVRTVLWNSKLSGDDRRRIKYKSSEPGQEKSYPLEYTPRQLQILSGEISLEVVSTTQLSYLANKAKANGDMEVYKKAIALREHKKKQGTYIPQMTLAEAKEILKCLTPEAKA